TMPFQDSLPRAGWRRFAYRLSRNPLVLFAIAPFYLVLINHRFASPKADGRQRRSVWWMNLVLLCTAASMSWIYGLGPYLLILSTVLLVAGGAGVWLFYV